MKRIGRVVTLLLKTSNPITFFFVAQFVCCLGKYVYQIEWIFYSNCYPKALLLLIVLHNCTVRNCEIYHKMMWEVSMDWTKNKYVNFCKRYCQLVKSIVVMAAVGLQMIPSGVCFDLKIPPLEDDDVSPHMKLFWSNFPRAPICYFRHPDRNGMHL